MSHIQPSELLRDWSGEELERVLFLESDVAKPGCKLPVRAPRTLIGSPLSHFNVQSRAGCRAAPDRYRDVDCFVSNQESNVILEPAAALRSSPLLERVSGRVSVPAC